MKHIAIKPLSFDDGLNLYHIKRDLLLFDEISVDPVLFNIFLKQLYYQKRFLDGKKGEQVFAYYKANYDYLIKEGFITFTSSKDLMEALKKDKNPKKIALIKKYNEGLILFNKEKDELDNRIKDVDNIIEDFKSRTEDFVSDDGKLFVIGENKIPVKTYGDSAEIEGMEPIDKNLNNFFEIIHQLRVAYSDNIYDKESISTSVRNNNNKRRFTFTSSSESVMNVILKKIPVPSNLTSFEQILDFRRDPDTTYKFIKFRKFVKDLIKPNINPKEALEQIEYALNEYEQHLKYHKLKYSTTPLELFIKAPLEILENTVKFKWKDIAKSLFDIRRNRIDFAQQEMKLKGNEVSYLHEIKTQFDPNSDMEKFEQMVRIERVR
ncbi:hypothetical protein ACFQO1_03270 [Jejudonia soesokkakensis]|uniref:Uncharacterized protein n=1 Tax=Jejudonia soesokkakensis TaxID=1323432 RepID=A0ABW2MQS9_9FLAO